MVVPRIPNRVVSCAGSVEMARASPRDLQEYHDRKGAPERTLTVLLPGGGGPEAELLTADLHFTAGAGALPEALAGTGK